MTSVAPASDQLPLNSGDDFEIDVSRSSHVVESWKYHRVELVCAIKLDPSFPRPVYQWINMYSNKTIKSGKHKDSREESVLRFSTKKDTDFGTYLCTVETDSTKKTHEIDIRKLRKPGSPHNIRCELHSIQDRAHLKVRLIWDPPESNGRTPITGYILKRKTRAGRWRNTRRMDTSAQQRSMLIKIKERKRYEVRIVAVNKVGWSEPNTIVLEEEIPEAKPEPEQPVAPPDPPGPSTGGGSSQGGATPEQKPELTIPAPFNKTHYDWLLSVENDEPEEWELVLRSDDAHVEVWRKENTAPSLFKIHQSYFNVPFEQVTSLMTDWEQRRQWDKTLASLDIVEDSEVSKTVQLILDMPTCYNNRELLITTADVPTTDGGAPCHVSLWQGTTHDDKPPPSNCCCKGCYCCCCDNLVRANVMSSGIIIRPVYDVINSIRVTMVMYTDFNGCCPNRSARKYFKQASVRWLQMIKDKCAKNFKPHSCGGDEYRNKTK